MVVDAARRGSLTNLSEISKIPIAPHPCRCYIVIERSGYEKQIYTPHTDIAGAGICMGIFAGKDGK
jgi:hypothetical protein